MAQKTVVVDDLTEDIVAADEAHVGVMLSFEGREVVLDLSPDNYNALAEAVTPYLDAGRDPSQEESEPAQSRMPAQRSTATADREATQAIREWARKNGFKVSERGRISFAVQHAFNEAHRAPKNNKQKATSGKK